MRFLAKLISYNLVIGALALFLSYFRYIGRPFTNPIINTSQLIITVVVLLVILLIILGLILTAGIRLVKDLAEFLLIYEKDPGQLRKFEPEKRIRVGVQIVNWPYTAFLITTALGVTGATIAFLITRFAGLEHLSMGSYLLLLTDFVVVIFMAAIFAFFFNIIFIPPVLTRIEEVGFPLPDFQHPGLIRIGLRPKLGISFLFIIFLSIYLLGSDIFSQVNRLVSSGQITEELIKSMKLRMVENAILVGIYAGGLGFFALRHITWNSRRLASGTGKIARGSLDPNPELRPVSVDELGEAADSINRMREALAQKVGQVVKQSEKMESILKTIREIIPLLAGSTEEMIRISRKQEAGAAQQSESIKGVQAGVEDLSVVAREISDGSTQVMERAEAALRDGEEGVQTIEFFRKSIENFAERAGEVGERIQILSLVGEEVERILKLIEGIANKSDVLALNAALEGAKAGEAGKGFMLIADNMRRLAELIVKEADQIRPILRQIETSTREIMGAIESNLAETRVGSGLMIQAHDSFQNIYRSVRKANETVYGILQGTSQQETLTLKIIEHATRVAGIASEGSSLSKLSTQTAEDLVEISNRLKSLLASGAEPGRGVPGK